MASSIANKAVVVGLSGCSSSGKTTLARLLRDIFPDTFVLHEDDFYRAETELPTKNGLLDWDCAEALSIPGIVKSLQHIHQEGTFPPDLDSKEDQNSIGPCPVPDSTITALKSKVQTWYDNLPTPPNTTTTSQKLPRICIFDGFLLYSPSMSSVQPHLDIKIFLRVSYAKAKARREARTGYVTLEGFWEDPPGYVDKIVWPNYEEDHAWMFEGGDVEGVFKEGLLEANGIKCLEGVDNEMGKTLEWVVESLMEELPKLI